MEWPLWVASRLSAFLRGPPEADLPGSATSGGELPVAERRIPEGAADRRSAWMAAFGDVAQTWLVIPEARMNPARRDRLARARTLAA